MNDPTQSDAERHDAASIERTWPSQVDAEQRSAEWLTNRLWPNETIEEAALALCEEAGEVARAVIKRNHADQGSGDRATTNWTANLRRELAQVVVVAMKMAEREGFSLIDMVLVELDALNDRWTELGSGSTGGDR